MQENNQNNIERYDDEINLGELFVNLWGQKWLIAICMIVMLVLSFAYVQTKTTIYEVKAVVIPAESDELADLNLNGLTAYTPEEAFKLYFKEIKSPTMLRQYYKDKEIYLLEGELTADLAQAEIDSRFLSFLESMKVINSTPEYLQKTVDGKIVTGSDASLLQADISWETDNSEKTADFINGYVSYVNTELTSKILKEQKAIKQKQLDELTRTQDLALEVEKQQRELLILKMQETQKVEISKVEAEIENAINAYFENVESQVAKLKESLAIAEKLKIVEPKTLADFYSENSLESQIEIYTNEKNLTKGFVSNEKGYLLGSKFLKAEIQELEKRGKDQRFVEELAQLNQKLAIAKRNPELEVLQNRKDDKPYVQAYLDTLDKVAKLDKITLKFEKPQFYQITQEALAPGEKVGRGKVIYLAIAIVLGAMLGLFLALINIAVKNYREKNK